MVYQIQLPGILLIYFLHPINKNSTQNFKIYIKTYKLKKKSVILSQLSQKKKKYQNSTVIVLPKQISTQQIQALLETLNERTGEY